MHATQPIYGSSCTWDDDDVGGVPPHMDGGGLFELRTQSRGGLCRHVLGWWLLMYAVQEEEKFVFQSRPHH